MTFKDTYIYIVASVILGIIAFTFFSGCYFDKEFQQNLLVEANGLAMDFFLIAILYEAYIKRKRDIKIERILYSLNTKIYEQTQSIIDHLLKIDNNQEYWIQLIFDPNSNKHSILSYSLEYYESIFKEFKCDRLKSIPQDETDELKDIITNYINSMTSMLNYHLIDEDQVTELELTLYECTEYLSRIKSQCGQRPVIRQLLNVLRVTASKATITKAYREERW